MNRGAHPDPVRWALFGAAVAIILASVLACRLDHVWATEVPDAASGAAARLLGESRGALSGDLYVEGDVFFHRGARYLESTAFTNRFYQRLGDAMAPRQHLHAQGTEAAEVLPWLRLATSADPHNVEAWMVAAFLAGNAAGRTDVAFDILAQARAANPRDYRLPMEQARILLRRHAWKSAQRELETAQRLWSNPPSGVDPVEARIDLAEALTYHGYLLELDGKSDTAIRDYRHALELFPARTALANRVDSLSRQQAPAVDIRTMLDNVFVAKAGDHEHDEQEPEKEQDGTSPHLSHIIH